MISAKGIFNAMQIRSELGNIKMSERTIWLLLLSLPAFHLLSLTKNFILSHNVEEVSVEMGFYYDDVAIYSDSMIYSNLRCFYQIKFVFCAKCVGLLNVLSAQIFPRNMNVRLDVSNFPACSLHPLSMLSERDPSPFCDKCEYL